MQYASIAQMLCQGLSDAVRRALPRARQCCAVGATACLECTCVHGRTCQSSSEQSTKGLAGGPYNSQDANSTALLCVQGTLEVGVFLAPGESATAVMDAGDVGFAPQGSGHYLRNLGEDMAHVVLIFNSGEFTNVDLNNFLGVFPPSWVAASLDTSTADARGIDYNLPGFAPALKPQPQQKRPLAGRQPSAAGQPITT
jgi:hypothetical protein